MSRTPSAKPSNRRTPPQVERLEDRLVPTINVENRLLTVLGTEQNDIIVVERQPGATDDLRITVYNRDTGAIRERRQGSAYDAIGRNATLDSLRIEGRGGNDILVNWTSVPGTLLGGAGSDLLYGGFADDTLDGGTGSDTYVYAMNPVLPETAVTINDTDPAWGQQFGRDTIREAAGQDDDTIDLRSVGQAVRLDLAVTGEQLVTIAAPGQTGPQRLRLVLESAEGVESALGGPLADTLRGNGRPNRLVGYGGADTLEGRGGDDFLSGVDGGDWYVFIGAALGHDTVYERDIDNVPGAADWLDFAAHASPVQVELRRTDRQGVSRDLYLTLSGPFAQTESAIENIHGSVFNDVLLGNELANEINGFLGNDHLYGFGGDDTLIGHLGGDFLNGGRGNDRLYGALPGIPFFEFSRDIYLEDLGGSDPGSDYHERWVYWPQLRTWLPEIYTN